MLPGPVEPLNAAIVLSILFLAPEIARTSLRHPPYDGAELEVVPYTVTPGCPNWCPKAPIRNVSDCTSDDCESD